MSFIFKGRYGQRQEPNPKFCAASVHEGIRGVGFYQCCRKPKVQREVDGKTYGFCKTHDPVAEAERRKQRQENWDKKWAEKNANWAKQDQEAKALKASKKALEQIARGHNDPRALAIETLKLFLQ